MPGPSARPGTGVTGTGVTRLYQLRSLHLARARRPVLLLDEPTAGLVEPTAAR